MWCRHVSASAEGDRERTQIVFKLSSPALDGARRLQAFVEAAMRHYKMQMGVRRGEESRRMYMPVKRCQDSGAFLYKSYEVRVCSAPLQQT